MKTGITGATGQLGRLVVEDLKKRTSAENVVALVRTPEKAADLGVEVKAFDYTQPDVESLKGIDNLLLISGNEIGQRETQHKNVINAAKEAGVKHIVYTSLLRADNSTLSLAPEHFATEEALKASGVPFTTKKWLVHRKLHRYSGRKRTSGCIDRKCRRWQDFISSTCRLC